MQIIKNSLQKTGKIKQQKGAVLFISLIILVIITLVTITAMNINNVQTSMAGGTLAQITALGSAESELPQLEAALNAAITGGVITSTCTNPPGQQNAPLDPSVDTAKRDAFRAVYDYANKPDNISYVITCTDRKSIQEIFWDSVTNTYVVSPSSTCLDYYTIEVTDSSGKGTRRVIETQFAITPVSC